MTGRPTAPELALARALELGAGAVGLAGGVATAVVAAAAGGAAGAGVAAGGVLALTFMWVTRVAVLRARMGEPAAIAMWVLLSYAAKFVLVVVVTALVARAGEVSRGGYAAALLVGVVVSVAAQTVLTRPSRTAVLDGVRSTVPVASHDDDAAAAAASAARAALAGAPQTAPPAADSVAAR